MFSDEIHEVSQKEGCPGCAILPMERRLYYPNPEATLHVDGDGVLFVFKPDLKTRVRVTLVADRA